MRILHIAASPGKDASLSGATACALLAAYLGHHPDASVDTLDVWDIDLPAFDATMIAAKFAVLRAQNATPEQQAQWARAVAISQRFNSADLYVFSLPMWNFGVPYRLKHFIDVVTLPGQNWAWSRQTAIPRCWITSARCWCTAALAITRWMHPGCPMRLSRNHICGNGCALWG
ncbi:FMN-dependent NADH-azoreductase [Andreprevotia sp. IGB-42]|uniref:FMN-dependent NADH-azoreductase n=1 Tax=Andreprevotia sp. IGB-42 TaxID=2497473 RepID=UPI00157F5334|nr:NAD(P)H-dependent oxidoreductase [Andreprevotia sp. IGB-42]KAF0814964.1 FMN-dependent NADH-azoreductase [Andreprevotia sp. IGB-42]